MRGSRVSNSGDSVEDEEENVENVEARKRGNTSIERRG